MQDGSARLLGTALVGDLRPRDVPCYLVKI